MIYEVKPLQAYGLLELLNEVVFPRNANPPEDAPAKRAIDQANCAYHPCAFLRDLPKEGFRVRFERVVLKRHPLKGRDHRRTVDGAVFECPARDEIVVPNKVNDPERPMRDVAFFLPVHHHVR